MPVNYTGLNYERGSFSECLKSMQEKCSHPEDERGELSDGAVICMCCGKVLSFDVEKVLKESGSVEEY